MTAAATVASWQWETLPADEYGPTVHALRVPHGWPWGGGDGMVYPDPTGDGWLWDCGGYPDWSTTGDDNVCAVGTADTADGARAAVVDWWTVTLAGWLEVAGAVQ